MAGINKNIRKGKTINDFTSQLLSVVSHQLKSPLAVIKNYATLLRDGNYGKISNKEAEIILKIEAAADNAIELVTNTIDLRKVEEGKMEYEFSKTDLVGLTKDVVEGIRILAETKGLKMTFTASAHDIFVNADPREMKHVVQNLVDNAIKYTEKGFINVNVREIGGEAVFSVADSGIGIPKGVKPLLFKEFMRDERVDHKMKGSGIGLHIARNIVEAHGGKIFAESAGDGKGSTFSFSLSVLK
ncbi:MAG: HAMP domain-containing histidine kinase [Patescibacteria group bacterium]|nr:HAMP domain-containing histidine kinase [Patescibacteria group bacterium]MDE2015796.1 HAMP domain-containing histidine kinase [Patescibacteria group bacterium]MDE2227171.1 HAMP domain-containing histidine kinase [Patescibacteria group bacterium]